MGKSVHLSRSPLALLPRSLYSLISHKRPWLALPLVFALPACTSDGVRFAREGDYSALRRNVARQDLSASEAGDIARAVGEREILETKKPEEAAARVRELRACAREIDSALEERQKTHDEAGRSPRWRASSPGPSTSTTPAHS